MRIHLVLLRDLECESVGRERLVIRICMKCLERCSAIALTRIWSLFIYEHISYQIFSKALCFIVDTDFIQILFIFLALSRSTNTLLF